MRPESWNPPIELSTKDTKIVKLIKRAKLFVFLREIRHLLFDESFQADLITGSSLKAEMDLNWDDPEDKSFALGMIINVLDQLEAYWHRQVQVDVDVESDPGVALPFRNGKTDQETGCGTR